MSKFHLSNCYKYALMLSLMIQVISSNSHAFTDNLSESSGRYFIQNNQRNLSQKGLHTTCFLINVNENTPPCNPAWLASFKEKSFGVNVLIGEDLTEIEKASNLTRGENKQELVSLFLIEQSRLNFEGSAQFNFVIPTFSFSVVIGDWSYFSQVINASYPDLALHAKIDRSIDFQFASAVNDNLSVGTNLRLVDRLFVNEQINLFDAGAMPESYFKIKHQNLLFVEPGFLYHFNDELSSILSFSLTNISLRQGDAIETFDRPVYDLGIGVTPRDWIKLGMSYRYVKNIDSENIFRLGGNIKSGLLDVFLSLSENEWAVGTISDYLLIKTSFMYRQKNINGIGDSGIFLEVSTNI